MTRSACRMCGTFSVMICTITTSSCSTWLKSTLVRNASGLSFDEGADTGAMVGADDQVTLPVAGDAAVGRLEAAVVDAEHGLGEAPPGPDVTGVCWPVVPARS